METESVLSSHSTRSNFPRSLNGLPKTTMGSFPALPPLPTVPANLTSLSNYSLRNINNLNSTNNYSQFSPTNIYSSTSNQGHSNGNINGILDHPSQNHYKSMTGNGSTVISPYHSSMATTNHNGRRNNSIQMNILSCSEEWADNTTAVSGMSDNNTDIMDTFAKASLKHSHDQENSPVIKMQHLAGYYLSLILCLVSLLSPIVMVLLPMMDAVPLKSKCDVDCDGDLISFSFKIICLGIGSWLIFFRKPRVVYPRLSWCRCVVLLFVTGTDITFWLFYSVRLSEQKRRIQYSDIVKYSESYVESLLVVHYLAVLLLEMFKNQHKYLVKIVRSPDGDSSSIVVAEASVQTVAKFVLDHYYSQFTIYNPYLEQLPVRGKKAETSYKYYDVDGLGNYGQLTDKDSRVGSPVFRAGKRDFGHNDLFYEEYEYERRLKKRRARLVTATEEAFAHIKRVQTSASKGPTVPLDSYEAAQSVFPSLVRPLQKYLRITRQQPRHTMDSILTHLANSIKLGLAPKAFLERYLVTRPVLQSEREQCSLQPWSLQSDISTNRSIKSGMFFTLRQGDVILAAEIIGLPHYRISEDGHHNSEDKFLINRDFV